MIVALSISPSGPPLDGTTAPDAGVSEVIAEAIGIIRASGLPCETNAMFTNIEGDWDEVMGVVKQAVGLVATRYPRVGIVLKADIRPGHQGQLKAKVDRVEEHLRGQKIEEG
jgi:uncharacterized protein YqgV (UPF0045/DUF77 family)